MRIKQEIIEKLRGDVGVRGRLCAACNKTYSTILRWIDDNDQRLTIADALKVIREEYGLTDDQILEDERRTA